jgi:myosin heavy subunit
MHIFKMEQDEYTKEGINWSKIDFVDNQGTIDLISKKPIGLLSLLDEESNFPKSTDLTLLGKYHQSHADNSSYIKPKTQQAYFGVRHYAGDVIYQVEGFLEKNRDTLRQDLTDMLFSSGNQLISLWFAPEPEEEIVGSPLASRGGSGELTSPSMSRQVQEGPGSSTTLAKNTTMKKTAKMLTTGYQFGNSLNNLVLTLARCNPFFVRCIKPNTQKTPKLVERQLVLSQLRYSGMLETIRVRRAGYTNRTLYREFLGRYGIISGDVLRLAKTDEKSATRNLLELVGATKDQWELGNTKIFFKGTIEAKLEERRAERIIVYVLKLQSFIRMARCRAKFQRIQKAVPLIQRCIRGALARFKARKRLRHITRVQAVWRGIKVRKEYASQLKFVRAAIAKKQEEAKIKVQEIINTKEDIGWPSELHKLFSGAMPPIRLFAPQTSTAYVPVPRRNAESEKYGFII